LESSSDWGTIATNKDTRIDTATNDSHPPALLTITEAAARLRIGRSTVYELIASGDLDVVHIGRSARVPVDALDEIRTYFASGGWFIGPPLASMR
jgi:excisionase family DNA binding protein